MDETGFQAFAHEWIEAWNSHDLDRVLSHYSDDVALTSPFIEKVLGVGQGSIRGKAALREYWAKALHKYVDLRFDLFRVYGGCNSLVLHYRSVAGFIGSEFMRFDALGKVCEVHAHYAPELSREPLGD